MPQKNAIIYTNIGFPEALHRRLKHLAVEEGRSLVSLVREAVAAYAAPAPAAGAFLRGEKRAAVLESARRQSPKERMEEGARLHAAARALFEAGLKSQGFSAKEISDLWARGHDRGA